MPFEKGVSGNPGGRSGRSRDLIEACRKWTDVAVLTIVGIMVNPEEKASDRLAAAKELLNRAHGKSPQVVSFDDGKDTRAKLFADILGAISDMRDVTAPIILTGSEGVSKGND